MVVDNVRANLRSGKSENYRVIGVLTPSSQVEVLQVDGEYAQVKTDEGLTGWVAARLLKMQPEAAPAKAAKADACETELGVVKQQLEDAEAQLAQAQAEQQNQTKPASDIQTKDAWTALGALALGIIIGMLLRERHYRKRLQGLRI
ncbi:MAG: TIGR04211 family SH3 domain-containing protein [Sulfuricellaceae bacterium]